MKTLALTLLFALISVSALAEPKDQRSEWLRCQFTEPFYTITYSETYQRYGVSSPDNAVRDPVTGEVTFPETVTEGVSRVRIDAKTSQLVAKDGTVLMTLVLDRKGSDGMSDTVYAYSALMRTLHGGCNSNLHH